MNAMSLANVMFCICSVYIMFSFSDATPVAGRTVPDFGKMYHVKGTFFIYVHSTCQYTRLLVTSCIFLFYVGLLSLPYAEIKEPFEAWYDLKGNRSRIDYYHGQ